MIIGTLCLGVASCTVPAAPGRSVDVDALLSAPQEVEIEGRRFILETYLWRDFMPVAPPGGRPLMAVIWITAVDHQAFPAAVTVERMWVVYKSKAWLAGLSKEERPREPGRAHQLEMIARDGPKWGPGVDVDVIVSVVGGDGKSHLLRAAKQIIAETR